MAGFGVRKGWVWFWLCLFLAMDLNVLNLSFLICEMGMVRDLFVRVDQDNLCLAQYWGP